MTTTQLLLDPDEALRALRSSLDQEHRRQREQLASYEEAYRVAFEVALRFPEVDPATIHIDDDEFSKVLVDVGITPEVIPGVILRMGVARFYDALPLLEALEAAGAVFTRSEDWPEIRRRAFSGWLCGSQITVLCFPEKPGAVCRVVPTGKTVPVLEMVCD